MRSNKANIAGLTSPGQQSEMKAILACTWPPLKPLPVFKYETAEYRATIDFDKKRGEWVCRKTSLPSNKVQELRGGLAEITMALPHGEAEMFIDSAEPQEPEPEVERDTNRRLQAIREWREKYENGARYFELRDFLSESQRTEMDDSLRLALTARQLQFNPKNVASVFDDLSVAGGRFAALIEFAKRNKARQGTEPQGEGVAPEAECAMEHDEESPEVSSGEFGGVLNNDAPMVREQEAAEAPERCTEAEEFPAVSIKDVLPEQELGPLAERMAHVGSRHFEIEAFEMVDEDCASLDSAALVEDPHPEERNVPAFADLAARARPSRSFVKSIEGADRIAGSSWRFPALKITPLQVNVIAILFILFLFAVTSFTVGLTVGRGPLGKRLREAPKSLLATEAKPPILPEEADESTPRTPPAPLAGSDNSGGSKKLDDTTPSEEKSKEREAGSENSAEVRSADRDSSPTIESRAIAKPEVNSEHSVAMGPIVRSMSPRVNPKAAHSRKAAGPSSSALRSPAPYGLSSMAGAELHVPRPSTALVTVPGGGSQPFRVNFPAKTIAATSSLAMTSQLSVLVPPEPGPAGGRAPARLEAGELVSFVWPRYATPRNRYGLAETIRVRATVGQFGQVLDVKFLGGSVSLLPATLGAVRQWRYGPTLLDRRPVQAQQDVTIEFRPERYSSRLSAQHRSHN